MPDRYMSTRMVTDVLPSVGIPVATGTKDTRATCGEGRRQPAVVPGRDHDSHLVSAGIRGRVVVGTPDKQHTDGSRTCYAQNEAQVSMTDREQTNVPADAPNPVRAAPARTLPVIWGVVLSLLIGAVTGIVAYRYTAIGKLQRTQPAPVAAPVSNTQPPIENQEATGKQPPVSGPVMVRKIDFQLVNGNLETTIAVDQLVPYDAHRLDQPDRVYIDLHGARLAPELATRIVPVNKGGVSRIRLSPTPQDSLRVVLDLEKRFDYSVVQQASPTALVLKLAPYTPRGTAR